MSTNARRSAARAVRSVVGAAVLAAPLSVLGAGPARASTLGKAHTCSGTAESTGILAGGTYSSVTIKGLCMVDAGQVVVKGAINVTPGSGLLAAYARNNRTHSGSSGLRAGSITVGKGATLILGCEAKYFACLDDPNQNKPTLESSDSVTGNITATDALGVVLHKTKVGGNVSQMGGGGGTGCAPAGAFAAIISPAYSDYEDDSVVGSLKVKGITSCYLGLFRDVVGNNLTVSDNKSTPGSMGVASNTVGTKSTGSGSGNLTCVGNSPAVEFGGTKGETNRVHGTATGQCSFEVSLPDPAPVPAVPATHKMPATPAKPAGPLAPIAAPALPLVCAVGPGEKCPPSCCGPAA